MQVQINTDASLAADQAMEQQIERALRSGLDRFTEHLSRAEVHLSDVNSSAKGGDADMRCALEVRLRGREPLAVHHQAPTVGLAAKGAIEKMSRALSNTMGKLAARTQPRTQPGIVAEEDTPSDAPPDDARQRPGPSGEA